tara:strand:- start:516 stop:626 length:111 start_codon:yes stop_codon:yes gene_type:complete
LLSVLAQMVVLVVLVEPPERMASQAELLLLRQALSH